MTSCAVPRSSPAVPFKPLPVYALNRIDRQLPQGRCVHAAVTQANRPAARVREVLAVGPESSDEWLNRLMLNPFRSCRSCRMLPLSSRHSVHANCGIANGPGGSSFKPRGLGGG